MSVVHSFANKEALAKFQQSPDWEKAVARAQYEKSVCNAARMVSPIFSGETAKMIDPGTIYPYFGEWSSEEGRAWTGYFRDRGCSSGYTLWPNMPSNGNGVEWQDVSFQALELLKPVIECGLFSKVLFCFNFETWSAMLVGVSVKWYPIVFWGKQEVLDGIFKGLKDLKEKREKEELAKRAAAVSPEVKKICDANLPKKSSVRAACITFAAFSLLMALVYGLVAIQEEDWRWLFLPRSEPASEIKNSGIRYVNEVFQGSDDYGHHRKNLRYFDNGSELPSGQIIGKAISDCQNRCRIIWLNKLGSCDNGVIVSKELFDQLKVGDQAPFVKPAEPSPSGQNKLRDF